MDDTARNKFAELLSDLPLWSTERQRREFVLSAIGQEHPAVVYLDFSGPPLTVAGEVVKALDVYRQPVADGSTPLEALLRQIKALGVAGKYGDTIAAIEQQTRPTVRRVLARDLDRSPQWGQLIEACGRPDHLFIFLHGDYRQRLNFFAERIAHYLDNEARSHRVVWSRFKLDGLTPQTAEEWELRLAIALGDGASGRLPPLVHQASQDSPLFLLLGQGPLIEPKMEEIDGLQELVSCALPRLIKDAQPLRPIRFLVAIEHVSDETRQRVMKAADGWRRALDRQRRAGLEYLELQEVKFPPWDEVETFVKNAEPSVTDEMLERIRQDYDRITQSQQESFEALSRSLDRYIKDY